MKRFEKIILTAFSFFFLFSCSKEVKGNRNFSAESEGFGGKVTVELSVKDEKITDISVKGEKETAAIGGEAIKNYNTKIFPALKDKNIKDFSINDIDSFTGASITSKAVRTALEEAVKKASGVKTSQISKNVKDGTYTASAPSYSVTELMTLDVTFKDNAITDINVKEEGSSKEIFATVKDRLIPRILKTQSLKVDAITGATVSSAAMKNIIADTIIQAGGNPDAWYTPVAKENKTEKIEGYDVIVVGLGGAGLTSYLSAAEQGASVFGIEKAAKIGGNSTNTSGPMAINPESRVKNNGGKFVEEEELINDWMDYTDNKAKKI